MMSSASLKEQDATPAVAVPVGEATPAAAAAAAAASAVASTTAVAPAPAVPPPEPDQQQPAPSSGSSSTNDRTSEDNNLVPSVAAQPEILPPSAGGAPSSGAVVQEENDRGRTTAEEGGDGAGSSPSTTTEQSRNNDNDRQIEDTTNDSNNQQKTDVDPMTEKLSRQQDKDENDNDNGNGNAKNDENGDKENDDDNDKGDDDDDHDDKDKDNDEDDDDDDDDSANKEEDANTVMCSVSYQWMDAGAPSSSNGGRVFHEAIRLTDVTSTPRRTFTVRKGDAVLLWSEETLEESNNNNNKAEGQQDQEQENNTLSLPQWKAQWVCRIEEMWQTKQQKRRKQGDGEKTNHTEGGGEEEEDDDDDDDEPEVNFKARWMFGKSDILGLAGSEWEGHIPRQAFLDGLHPKEVVFTNQIDVNDISTIQGPCQVLYRPPDASVPEDLAEDSFLCRYKLDIDAETGNMTLTDCDVEKLVQQQQQQQQQQRRRQKQQDQKQEQEQEQEQQEQQQQEQQQQGQQEQPSPTQEQEPEGGGGETNETVDTLSSDDDSESSGPVNKVIIPEGEGSTLRDDILVGDRHQAVVGRFVPGQSVKSRNPKLVWEPGRISDEDLQDFLDKLGEIHTPFLIHNELTMEDPYSPLPADEAEQIMRKMPGNKPLTGSFMSTASSLSKRRNNLLKECDADAVLELLHDHNYDKHAALAAIKDDLNMVTSAWTKEEKETFNDGFRRFQGSLKMIGNLVSPNKSFRDVLDYQYRFKIPDQFRRYQDKKREQAVRMMECIEKRRYHESATDGAGSVYDSMREAKRRKTGHWSETAASDVTEATEERRRTAKDLLMDVQSIMGRDLMGQVAALVRQLHQAYDHHTRDALFSLLTGQPELQKRFLAFLPKY